MGDRKLYSSHDTLEGVQFREQRQVEIEENLAIVVRELADVFYDEFQSVTESSEEPAAELTTSAPDGEDRKDMTLCDFE